MIQLDQHESEYLKICKHFRAIYDTNSIQEDSEKKKEVHLCVVGNVYQNSSEVLGYRKKWSYFCSLFFQALKCVLLYLILAPFDNEQSDLIHRVKEDKYLENIPKYQ